MNIPKNYLICKQLLNARFNLSLIDTDFNKIHDNYRKDKDFLRSGKYGFLTSANCNDKPGNDKTEQTKNIVKEVVGILITDKFYQNKFLSVVKGNTLIIGEAPSEVLYRGLQFHKIYLKHGFLTKLLSFREFASLSFDEQTTPDIHYIVRFNKHNDIDDLPHPLSTVFSNIFVFALSNIDENVVVGTEIKIGSRASDILARLAITTAHARKYLLPSLKKMSFL